MISLIPILFAAGVLTILLPCILPLVPIVLGVSIAGKSRLRPLLTIAGMLVSFVGFSFLLLVVLRQFVEVADYLRIGTYYVLLLFGLGFFTSDTRVHVVGAIVGSMFFLSKGLPSVLIAAVFGMYAMHVGGRVASKIQTLGSHIQSKARGDLGEDNPLTAFVIGLTMGLVWVPCAGPALGFAFTLVREQPGIEALILLTSYGLGTAVPLLLIGYGGQWAVNSVQSLKRLSGSIKKVSGVILILTAFAFQFHWFIQLESWLVQNTTFGTLGTEIEEKLFGEDISMDNEDVFEEMAEDEDSVDEDKLRVELSTMTLPKLVRAPELTGLSTWHNSDPLTLAELKGKVVLVDFWTYSCINCIRTIPYLKGYWEKFKDKPFVLLGIHTPEFVFEKSEKNVADAIKRHGITWPVAQDNDFGTWRAFANRYWPAKYLIDAEGYVRYTHFGEGAYETTEKAIQSLLQEIDVDVTHGGIQEEEKSVRRNQTPEIYLSLRSIDHLSNPTGSLYGVQSYTPSSDLALHTFELKGEWEMRDDERQILRQKGGEIRLRFLGSEANLVLGLEDGVTEVEGGVIVDGEVSHTFMVDRNDLYSLFQGEYGEHELILTLSNPGVSAYAFTFGS